MRRLLPSRTPIALLHSIHDAAIAQSFADFVDGNLSTPLCEEKLIATYPLPKKKRQPTWENAWSPSQPTVKTSILTRRFQVARV